MPVIRIQQTGRDGAAFLANLSFDGISTFPIRVTNPFTPEQEKNLEWYFEEHLRFPFADKVRARDAGKSVYTYGNALFDQVFADRDAFAAWSGMRTDLLSVRFEIVGPPEFQSLHWEALVEPKTQIQLSTHCVIVRKHTVPQLTTTRLPESPTVNILLVVARPSGGRDMSYRTISRPLVTALDNARIRASIDIVRPGTFEAMLRHLDENRVKPEAERYHVVHFDLHGGLLTYEELTAGVGGGQVYYQPGVGLSEIEPYEGEKAFLLFAGQEAGKPTYVEADQLAHRLIEYGVPVAVLNACQSGKQVGAQETSLASRLTAAGLQLVVGMTYSVTVTAAVHAMTAFYRLLLSGQSVASSVVGSRRQLELQKERKAYFGQSVDLEDWMLPVIYESREVQLTPKRLSPEEEEPFFKEEAARYAGASPEFGFFGRDLDILYVENRLLASPDSNILLIRGMGGAGKSTLLKHVAAWWQRTGLIEEVFYFGYDEKAHNRQQILWAIAKKLFSSHKFTTFESSSPDVQQSMVATELRRTRHLLMFDNLESITGERLSIPNTLPENEQKELQSFLHAIRGGQSLVLLGSRSDEKWLASGTFAMNVYELDGLDPEAASNLADRILEARGANKFKADKDLVRLIKLLAGFPLALEVVLSNLPAKSPTAILEELEAGGLDLNTGDANDKTRSIVACIAYSHSNLSEEAQALLLCLGPFSGVFNSAFLETFTDALKAQPLLADLNFDRWSDVLVEAQNMGLMTADLSVSPILRLQPVFPYFLRTRLNDPLNHDRLEAIEAAFREYYRSAAGILIEWMKSNEPGTRQLGLMITGLEGENLRKTALDSATAGEDFFRPLRALSYYFDISREHEAGLTIARAVRERLAARAADGLQVPAAHLSNVLDEMALRLLDLNKLEEAKDAYREKLVIESHYSDDVHMSRCCAATLHQLGRVAELQRQWRETESYYKQALATYVELDDRYEQADTLHQLGIVAQKQHQWSEAESYYKQALAIKVEFKDRYGQAATLHQLGNVAFLQHQWLEAESYCKQALTIYVEFNNRYEQAGPLHQLGVVAEVQRQWSEAESYYKQALAILVEFSDRYSQAITLHQLGRVAADQRLWPEAESYYKQSLTIKVEFNDQYSQASTLHELGLVAAEQHLWPKAERYYKQSLTIKVEFNDRYSQASTLHQLGRVAEEQHRWPEAESYYMQALTIVAKFKDEHRLRVVMSSLARLWRASGDDRVTDETASILDIGKEEIRSMFEQILHSSDSKEGSQQDT